jgi:hypothetical protein
MTDSEVDRRFATLVATLNFDAVAAEWPRVSDAAPPSDDQIESSPDSSPSIAALRIWAAVIAILMAGVGVALVASLGISWLFLLVWLVLVVPAAALAAVYLVDALGSRGRRAR